jgi:hypothetical protein
VLFSLGHPILKYFMNLIHKQLEPELNSYFTLLTWSIEVAVTSSKSRCRHLGSQIVAWCNSFNVKFDGSGSFTPNSRQATHVKVQWECKI